MAFPSFNLTNASTLVTFANKTVGIISKISSIFSPKAIPSLLGFLAILILVLAIVKVGVKITSVVEDFLSKYLPIIVLFVGMTIYIPIYNNTLTQMFTVETFDPKVNKTITVPDQQTIQQILKYQYIPPAYWDRVLYYGIQKQLPEDLLWTPFIILFALFLYFTFVTFQKYLGIGSPIFSFLALLLITGGGLGILAIFTHWNWYTTYVLLYIAAIIVYYIYYTFKKLFE